MQNLNTTKNLQHRKLKHKTNILLLNIHCCVLHSRNKSLVFSSRVNKLYSKLSFSNKTRRKGGWKNKKQENKFRNKPGVKSWLEIFMCIFFLTPPGSLCSPWSTPLAQSSPELLWALNRSRCKWEKERKTGAEDSHRKCKFRQYYYVRKYDLDFKRQCRYS